MNLITGYAYQGLQKLPVSLSTLRSRSVERDAFRLVILRLMSLKNMTWREILLFAVGGYGITLLVFMTVSLLYSRDYRRGILCLVVASALAFIFFRKRKIALATISLS